MDAIGAIGLGTTDGTAGSSVAQSGLGGLDSDAFMNLMVAQLRYQDPLAPSDTNGLMQQTSILAQTEMLTQVSKLQQQLLGLQRANTATDLLGTQVEGVAADGSLVSGTVDAVRFDVSGPVLLLGDAEVALENATRIGAPATAAPPTPAASTTDPVDPASDGTAATTDPADDGSPPTA